ncbi:MAG: phosphodiester glycosidase family protein [Chloroflexota bacterium]
MTISKLFSRLLVVLLCVGCLAVSYSLTSQTPIPPTATPTLTFTPAPTFTPALPPMPETAQDTGWDSLQPGLERRKIDIYDDQNQQVEALYLLRLDQGRFWLDVAYHETPQNLENWQKETNALVVLNGGYFRIEDEKYIPNGLTVVNGETLGSSYGSFAGMLAISDYGTELRWLEQRPYNPYEQLRAALQSFPMLVKPGGELGFAEEHEDNVKARRTVIGQDRSGRILFIVAPRGYFTLHQLSVYLTGSDFDLNIAVNLDGGPSTGIWLAEPRETISSQTLLPIVILAYPR